MLDLGDNFDWRSILWHASNGLLARSRKETLLLTHEPSFRRQRQCASLSLTGEFNRLGYICLATNEALHLAAEIAAEHGPDACYQCQESCGHYSVACGQAAGVEGRCQDRFGECEVCAATARPGSDGPHGHWAPKHQRMRASAARCLWRAPTGHD